MASRRKALKRLQRWKRYARHYDHDSNIDVGGVRCMHAMDRVAEIYNQRVWARHEVARGWALPRKWRTRP